MREFASVVASPSAVVRDMLARNLLARNLTAVLSGRRGVEDLAVAAILGQAVGSFSTPVNLPAPKSPPAIAIAVPSELRCRRLPELLELDSVAPSSALDFCGIGEREDTVCGGRKSGTFTGLEASIRCLRELR